MPRLRPHQCIPLALIELKFAAFPKDKAIGAGNLPRSTADVLADPSTKRRRMKLAGMWVSFRGLIRAAPTLAARSRTGWVDPL